MDIKALAIALPTGIQQAIDHGEYTKAYQLIDHALSTQDEPGLTTRLLWARKQIDALKQDYPLNKVEAFKLCQCIDGFTMEAFDQLVDANVIDSHMNEGELRFRKNIVSSIVKSNSDYAKRCPSVVLDADLTKMIDDMMEKGKDQHRFTIKQWVDLSKIDHPVNIWFPLPLLKDGQINLSIVDSTIPLSKMDHGFGQCNHGFVQTDGLLDRVELTYQIDVVREFGILGDQGEPSEMDLNACQPQIIFKPELVQLVHDLTNGIGHPMVKTRVIYDYITTHFTYRFQPSYITIDGLLERMLSMHQGDCGMYALLMVTMCRIANIPARFESGIYVYPLGPTIHDWMAYYIEGKGWIHCDPQMGSDAYFNGRTKEHAFFYDHIDCYHLIYNHGFQLDFTIQPPVDRFDPYDNQYPEVQDGQTSFDPTIVPRGFTIVDDETMG